MAQQTFKAGTPRMGELSKKAVDRHHSDLSEAGLAVVETNKGAEPIKVVRGSPNDKANGIELVVVYVDSVLNTSDEQIGALLDHALNDYEGVEKEGRRGAPPRQAIQRRKRTAVHLAVLARHPKVVAAIADWKKTVETAKKIELPILSAIAAASKGVEPAPNAAAGDDEPTPDETPEEELAAAADVADEKAAKGKGGTRRRRPVAVELGRGAGMH